MDRISTDILLWLYWTVLLAVVVCAIPAIIIYALLFDEDEPMRECCKGECGTLFVDVLNEGRSAKCPVCGYRVSVWVPSQHDIRCGCSFAQSEWTANEEQSPYRNSYPAIPADTLQIHQHPRGRRVMRERASD